MDENNISSMDENNINSIDEQKCKENLKMLEGYVLAYKEENQNKFTSRKYRFILSEKGCARILFNVSQFSICTIYSINYSPDKISILHFASPDGRNCCKVPVANSKINSGENDIYPVTYFLKYAGVELYGPPFGGFLIYVQGSYT